MPIEPIDADDADIAVATIQLVGELGADKVTVTDVRKHLGIGEGAMERLCSSEEDLWHTTIRFITQGMYQSWDNCIASALPPRQRLRALLTNQIELVTGTPALRDILFSRRLNQNHTAIARELRNARDKFEQLIADIVAEGKASGDFPDVPDPDIIVRGITELLQGFILNWSLALQPDISLDEIWSRLDGLLEGTTTIQNVALIFDEITARDDIKIHLERS
ncbi:MAG: hypothetical protein RO009_01255 [Pseudorhodoplanes sp.]|jgi:AcrR family transcriptional regulator|nr:hypothetical protein [Pseudorhodoplanes sp.]